MDNFTQEDHDWFQKIKENPNKYKIVIDNDCVSVDTVGDDPEDVYTFSSFGYEFIHALLNDMGINAEYC